jgi:hypothetical protein
VAYRPHGVEWDELGKIDYFLNQLARAEERGEVPDGTYARMAPRYLERRADLAAIIAGENRPQGVPQAAPAPAPAAAPAPSWGPAAVPTWQPKPVKWTTVLTFTGAFLVIVAAAIFAVATWDLFSAGFKIGFLGLLTAGFYVAGYLVRTRLDLIGGGITLTVVASAMLLFDGWIVIDGYGLEGPWPWVGWLFVCSAAYWFTETRIAGRFFGAIGAAAQVAWIWLLGQGLGWTTAPRMAAIAVIAAVWALVAERVDRREPFASLATVLRWAAPVVVTLAAVGVATDIGIAPVGWSEIAGAIIVGLAGSFVLDTSRLPRGLGAGLWAPAFLACVSRGSTDADWALLGAFVVIAVAAGLYELARGGWGHGVLALLAELGAWLVLAEILGWDGESTVALMLAVGGVWVLASGFMAREATRDSGASWQGLTSLAATAQAGGWALLSLATLTVPLVQEKLPLTGSSFDLREAILPVFALFVWVFLGLARRTPGAALAAFPLSLYATAAVLAWAAPEWHSALYATGLILVLLVWLLVRGPIERVTHLAAEVSVLLPRVTSLLVVVIGLAASEYFFETRSWQVAVMLAVFGIYWLVDALIAEESRAGLTLAGAAAVATAATLGWWRVDAEFAALAGAGTALAAGLGGAFLRSSKGYGTFWTLGACAAGTFAALAAADEPGVFASALALATLAWMLGAFASRIYEVALLAAFVGTAAVFSAFAHFDVEPWLTVVVALLAAFGLLAPSFFRWDEPGTRTARALALAGLAPQGLLVLLGLASWAGDPVAAWADIGGEGYVVALAALGAYVIVAGIAYRLTVAPYVGGLLLVAAGLAELAVLEVSTLELYTTLLAAYLVWAGLYFKRSAPSRTVPPLIDVAVVAVGLGLPTLYAIGGPLLGDPWEHLVWAVGLSLLAIGAGVSLKVRAYFFGGVAALVLLALARTWIFLVAFWWLILGIIGIVMLVVALTWERQRQLLALTGSKVRDTFEGWR